MLTVRFPNGSWVRYNEVTHFTLRGDNSGRWDLYTDKAKTRWVASIQTSAGAVVEATAPCATGSAPPPSLARAIQEVMWAIDARSSLTWSAGDALADLKRALGDHFDARTKSWK